jgi:hypothetical protein
LIAIAGGAVYVTGAAVLESGGYKMLSAGSSLSVYRAEVAAEEFLEMMGASLILYAVLLFCCLPKNNRACSARTSPRIAL